MSNSEPVFFGVDFSGAAQPKDAIWITEAKTAGETLTITDSSSVWERFGLPRSASRTRFYEALLEFIAHNPNGVFGFDFPFSLPHQILSVDSWQQHIETMPDRYEIETPDEFREACTIRAERATGGTVSHLRRETDFRYAAQCPYQRQIQNQTLYGQSDLLRPLIERDQARVLPMQEIGPDLPVLVEVYPAATLGVLRTYRNGYKNHPRSRERRRRMLDDLQSLGFRMPEEISDRCIGSDDALDSVICAIAGFRAHTNGFERVEKAAEIEGQIYA